MLLETSEVRPRAVRDCLGGISQRRGPALRTAAGDSLVVIVDLALVWPIYGSVTRRSSPANVAIMRGEFVGGLRGLVARLFQLGATTAKPRPASPAARCSMWR